VKRRCLPACLGTDDSLAFLRGQLEAAEEQLVVSHLEECELCRRQIESTAADRDAWHEVSELLELDPWRISVQKYNAADRAITPTVSLQINQVIELLQPTDDPKMLGRLGAYEISGVIGGGGMGVVLKATDRSLDRIVAIKVLSPHLASSGAARTRFEREAKAAAALLHPNVIAIHGVSSASVLPFLVMPYVRGGTLQQRIDSQGPLPVADILRLGVQIASGLAAAHKQGLVHRDIKPANILLENGVERVAITDFGLARAVDDASVTKTGVIAGTPQYMSPEQARGEAIDHRTDLFSLGSVLYTICTGRPPFRAETTFGVLRRITDCEPRPISEINPDIPVWLAAIVQKLHEKDPRQRFDSAATVSELLAQSLAHVQQPNSHGLPPSLEKLSRTRDRLRIRGLGLSRLALPLASASTLLAFAFAAAMLARPAPSDQRSRMFVNESSKDNAFLSGSSSDPSAESNQSLSEYSDSLAGWDFAEHDVLQSARDVDRLTIRADRIWDDMPEMVQTRNNFTTRSQDNSPHKERTK